MNKYIKQNNLPIPPVKKVEALSGRKEHKGCRGETERWRHVEVCLTAAEAL